MPSRIDIPILIHRDEGAHVHAGTSARLSRILNPQTGCGIVVAVDHGLFMGPTPGVEDARATIARVADGGPDAIQVSPGIARAAQAFFLGRGAPALVLRVDASNTWRAVAKPSMPYRVPVATVEDALQLDADAVVTFLFTGYPDDRDEGANLRAVGELASACRRWGVPLVVEPLAVAVGRDLLNDPDVVALMVRIACEAGADLIKADYTGDPNTFARVVRASTVPVLVRGGPKVDTPEQVLTMAADAVAAGARGVVFGRNIWQHENPAGVVRALRRVIHDRARVSEALSELVPYQLDGEA